LTGPGPGPALEGDAGPVPGEEPRAKVTSVRVGVGLLLGIITVLVLVVDVLLAGKPAFRVAAPGCGLLLAALSAAALLEFYALLERAGIPSHARYGALASAFLLALRAILPAAGVRAGDAAALALVGGLLAVLGPAWSAIGFRPRDGENQDGPGTLRPLAGTALGLLLVHFPIALLLELRLVPDLPGVHSPGPAGLLLATMVVLACKAGDSAAYFVGRTVGRTPLCRVSPKKTWEGAVGGTLAGTAAGAALGGAFGLPLTHGITLALLANLAGQGGDLLESWVKRACGAKDSGSTFGEMGGALDLVDALLLAGPAGFLFHQVVLN